jgi:hypothetical protein
VLAARGAVRHYGQSMLPDRSLSNRRLSRSLSQNLLAALGLAAPLLLLAQALTSCGSDDEPGDKLCNAGDFRQCIGPAQCTGTQACNDTGTGYAECDCNQPGGGGSGGSTQTGGGSAGTSNSAGSGNTPVTNLLPGSIATPCESDADCPTLDDGTALLTCLLATSNDDFGSGGPQAGYCSLPCASTDDCREVDEFSTCGTINTATGAQYCIALCQPGDPQAVGANLLKCGANRAQACLGDDGATVGGCFPICTSDAACGPNRFCDPGGVGLCLDAAPAGGGVGAPCTADTEEVDCASQICLEFLLPDDVTTAGFCSANCTAFAPQGCGFDETSAAGGVREAACIQTRFETGGPGDLGFCVELCNTDADCAQAPAWECGLFENADAEAQLGRLGSCIPAELNTPVGADAGL